MNKQKLISITILLLMISGLSVQVRSQSSRSILYTGVTIHTGTGTVLSNAYLGIRGSQIELVSTTRSGSWDSIVNLEGKHIWPGFISLNSSVGLREIDAVRSTLDLYEVGEMNPHVRSMIAFNTDSKIIPTLRSNGVLFAQACPRGGIISGSSSVFRLDGWNWEDAVLKADDGIHLNWPEASVQQKPGDTTKAGSRNREALNKLRALFEESVAYGKQNGKKTDLRLKAMQALFTGKAALYIHANKARDILDAIEFARSFGVEKVVIVGASDAWMITRELKENNVMVVLGRLHRLPPYPDAAVELPFELPAILTKAGIITAISYDGGKDAAGTRNLGYTAGTAAAYGLSKEQALQLITLNPAKIAGIDKTHGSIEPGKNASFFITAGDALDMRTSTVEQAFIDGRSLDLDNLHKQLYRKYSTKYGIEY